MRIAHFTAGTVGAGHLAHAVAVRRGLERAGFSGEFQIFGPPNAFPASEREGYQSIPVIPEEVTNPYAAPESKLANALNEYAPDLLVAEMFWAPLMYILPLQNCEHWLLIRRCPPIWLEGSQNVPFDPTHYDRIIAFEPMEHPVFTDALEPIVICNPDECRPPTALRELLYVPENNKLAVVAHAGSAGEIDEIGPDEVAGTTIARFDLREESAPFPIAEWLPGADEIYMAAGYNCFWEARWLGYHDRTDFTPYGRFIDDQQWRLTECAHYTPTENGADQLARWILGDDAR